MNAYCEEGVLVTRDISGGAAGADGNAEEGGNEEDYEIVLYEDVEAPLAAGDQVGYISYVKADGTEAQAPVVVREDDREGGPWTKIYISDFHFWAGVIMVAIVAVPLLLGSLARRKSVRRGQTRSQRYAQTGSAGGRRRTQKKRRRR